MRRVRYYEHGGPEVLRLEEADVPTPGPGQALVQVDAIGANFVDTKFRAGGLGIFTRPLPGELTGDVVGTVTAVGPDTTRVAVGDRVAALADPAFAEYVLVDAEWSAPVPDGMTDTAASTLAMTAPVALRVLRTGHLGEGETVLVHAAAGGIGHLAVQLARLLGAGTVIATASSAAKLEFARSLGADVAVDYTQPDWVDQVRAAVPGGVDVIADSIGGEITQQGMQLLAPFGRTIVYGAASGALADVRFVDLAPLKYAGGFSLLAWRAARPEQAREEMTELAGYLRDGRLRVTLHGEYPMSETAEVHRLLEDRGQIGRLIVRP
ncbi:quinone oxidoreductase family protein [Actinokineospora enzanensis]|uniref:quinone oxidoreductase family protein n=1 Tax=Actinokineospora enzanensis TaxID=155975 RepID=UPI000475B4B8|nr:zinc-binding dehydrogenase [Actinokineospora enzanensis]